MFSMKKAALVGLASADRTLFAPVAAPYGQVTPAYEQAVAYPMSADAMYPVQPVEFVQPEPQDSQTWLWAGAGALALVGAYAARSAAPSAVASLDAEDLESAQIATLGVGGLEYSDRQGEKKKGQGWSLTGFLMQGRKGMNDGKFGELELLSGATRAPSDSKSVLDNRFKMLYDTRGLKNGGRQVAKKTAKKEEKTTGGWRSKNQMSSLYK